MDMGERGSSHLIPLDTEIHVDFSCPLSVPSQPPDIRNWFSSYVYESPDFSDLPQVPGSLKLPENDGSETDDPLGILESQNQTKMKFSDGISQDGSILRDDQIKMKDSPNVPAEITRKYVDNDSVECNDPVAIDADELSGRPVARSKRKPNSQQVLEGICTGKSRIRVDTLQDDKASMVECNNEELEAREAQDGFISTKKRERGGILPPTSLSINRESLAAAGEADGRGTTERLKRAEVKENNAVSAGREESEARRGGPLADITNVRAEQGIPGKWQCPRKGKPYAGPPLKQLRLQSWFRRAN